MSRGLVRLTAGIRGTPPFVSNKLNPLNINPGVQSMEKLVNAGLANVNNQGVLSPQLAEGAPTLEDGSWRLFDDGTMQTTWKLKPGAQWHDGTPFTSADILFTARAERDPGFAWTRNPAYDFIERVEAPDEHTVTITWKQAYVEADYIFTASNSRALPLPRHILEQVLDEDHDNFLNHPYWSREFVGTGPYRVKEWGTDTHASLVANDAYVLGRPKIDEITVLFIGDSNALAANVLAGEVEYTMDGRSLSLEEAKQTRDQWPAGHLELGVGGVETYTPQFLNSRPAVIGDVRFRKALMYALNREEMVETIQGGLGGVAHSHLDPNGPEYKQVEGSIVRYGYEPARTAQLIEGLGYIRGADGLYRDGSGQTLEVEAWTTVTQINQKTQAAVVDSWQRAGIKTDPITIPLQRGGDREYLATFPGFLLTRSGTDLTSFRNYISAQAALPENGFAGNSRGRYRNAEYDALVERYYVTIPVAERMQVVASIVNHMSDQVVVMRLFFDPEATLITNRLKNVPAGLPWNVHEWEPV